MLRCDGSGIPVCPTSSSSSESSISESAFSASEEFPSEPSVEFPSEVVESAPSEVEESAPSEPEESSNILFVECDSSTEVYVEFRDCATNTMPKVLPSGEAGDAQVILIDGVCFERVGVTLDPPDDDTVDAVFNTCEECESSTVEEVSSLVEEAPSACAVICVQGAGWSEFDVNGTYVYNPVLGHWEQQVAVNASVILYDSILGWNLNNSISVPPVYVNTSALAGTCPPGAWSFNEFAAGTSTSDPTVTGPRKNQSQNQSRPARPVAPSVSRYPGRVSTKTSQMRTARTK
jgi:hypothetical protein